MAWAQTALTAHFLTARISIASGLNQPNGVAVDGSGNVYIADTSSGQVLKVAWNGSSFGTPSTIASGLNQPSGVAVDRSGNVYIAEKSNNQVLKVAWDGSSYGTPSAILSGLNLPRGVAVDGSGNVYIADTSNSVVLKLPWNGSSYGTQSTIASSLNQPSGVAVDGSGNVYIADTSNDQVLKVPWNGNSYGTQNTISTGLNRPRAVAVDSGGNVYIADANNRVLELPWDGTSYGTRSTISGGLNQPAGVAVDGVGYVYIADTNNNRVLKERPSGGNFETVKVGSTSSPISIVFTIDTGGTLGGTGVLTQGATGLDFTDAGTGTCKANQTYGDGATCTVDITFTPKLSGIRYGAAMLKDSSGTFIATGYCKGTGSGPQVNYLPGAESTLLSDLKPYQMAVDSSGNIYVTDKSQGRVLKLPWNGSSYGTPAPIAIGLTSPVGVAVDGGGNVYISDATTNGQVLKLPWNGSSYGSLTTVLNGLDYPAALAVDASGNLYIVEANKSRVLKAVYNGSSYGTPSILVNASFSGVAVDGWGNVYFTSYSDTRVFKLHWNGISYDSGAIVAANGFTYDEVSNVAVAVDGWGNVYFTEVFLKQFYGQVVQVPWNGSSYGTPRTLASGQMYPYGVAVDGGGNVYVGDAGFIYDPSVTNGRVLKENYAAAPTLDFGTMDVGSGPSAAQDVTVQNVGNAPLSISSISLSANFNAQGSDTSCSLTAQTLDPQASCVFGIEFQPTVAGNITGSLVLTDDNLNASSPLARQTITLLGTATHATPTLSLTNSAVTYNGSAQPATVIGSAAGIVSNVKYNGSSTVPTNAGTYAVTADFTPAESNYYNSLSGASAGSFTIDKATPALSVVNSPVTYNASAQPATVTVSVAGTVSNLNYNGSSTVPTNAGTYAVTADFAPTDAINYNSLSGASAGNFIVAPKAATWTTDAASKNYGAADPSPLTTGSGSGFLAADNVTATYSRVAGETVAGGPYAITATLSPAAVLSNYSITNAGASFTINKLTASVIPNAASKTYGAADPTFTGALSGFLSTDDVTATYSRTAGETVAGGPYTIRATLSPTSVLGNYNVEYGTAALSITKAATSAALQTSATTVMLKSDAVLTAKVTSTSGAPTGSITFMDGNTALGTAALDNRGTATLAISTLLAGAHNLTAVYSGDSNFSGATSTAANLTVQDFQLAVAGGSTTSITVLPGALATYQLTLTPTNGTSFPAAVTLALTGLPAGATHTITPVTIAAGSGTQTITVRVQTAKIAASLHRDGTRRALLAFALLPMLGIVHFGRAGAKRKRAVLMLGLLLAFGLLGMTGCGGGSGFLNNAPQTYNLQLNGASGALQHSVTLSLTIQ